MLLGIVRAYWQGTEIPLKTGSSFELGGISSKPQVVGTNIDFSNSMEASAIMLKVAVEKGSSLYATFPAGVPGELQIECDSGQTYAWPSAFRNGTIKITTGESSEAEVNFAAGTPLEQVS